MAEKFTIAKVDDEQRLVFGWANVAVNKIGQTVTDLQGDQIEPADLEAAAYEFVVKYRETGEMHEGAAKGRLVESMVFTPEKLSKMGLPADALPARWWVGFQLEPETFAKVKDGTYTMFSIQGTAEPEEVAA